MVAEFDDVVLRAGVERLRRLFGAGAVAEARRQSARYACQTWGGQWWTALLRELRHCRSSELRPPPKASIRGGEGTAWIAVEEFLETL